MQKADIGLIGLAVMGENLVLNMESRGFTVAVYNRTTSKVDDFVNGRAADKNIIGAHSVEELCERNNVVSIPVHIVPDVRKWSRRQSITVHAGDVDRDDLEEPPLADNQPVERRNRIVGSGSHALHRTVIADVAVCRCLAISCAVSRRASSLQVRRWPSLQHTRV